ncbi:MAG: hypothetical protein JXA22_01390 [Candidatus Thermoplasmatota archaeon]|nr:hypothetical protein [Candidatus Thermoplasmatota archaeon]
MSCSCRVAAMVVCFLMVAISVIVWGPVEEDAEGYATYNYYAPGSSTDYLTGYVVSYRSGSTDSFNTYKHSYPPAGGWYYSGTDYGYYRGWIPVDISDMDPDTLISQISFNFYPSYIGSSQTLRIYMLKHDPRDRIFPIDSQWMYYSITDKSYSLGSTSVSSYQTYTVSTTSSTTISYLRSLIENGEDYVFFGIEGSSNNGYIQVYGDSHTYMTITGDMEAPNDPSPDPLTTYTTTQHVSLDWSEVSDRPTGPCYGGVEYKVGAFSSTLTDSLIWSSDWSATSSMKVYGLQEGTHYFRLKAKDAGDFETDWSSDYASTTIDRTPPTTAQIFDLPEYTNGTSMTLDWISSMDKGSGVKNYMVGYATESDFSDQENRIVNYPTVSTSFTLTPGETMYFVLLTYDKAGLMSDFSLPGQTTCDVDPPSVPIMMHEPAYTRGDSNSFSWYPSLDDGVGVHHYKVQLATTEDFHPASIVSEHDTDLTTMEFDTLEDDVKYFTRVQAVDAFHHESVWSGTEYSIQDHRGPGELGLVPLMEYQSEGPVHLEWDGAEDVGSGVAWYEVLWSTDPAFLTDVHSKDHVLGQSFQITGLDPGTAWHIKVVPYDSLGNPGVGETTFTTIDPQPPEQPVIGPLEEYTGGRTSLISWSASTDALSGLDHYLLNVYTSPDRVGLAFSVHTTETSFEVPGLSDGTTYYYEVTAMDMAGNGICSALAHSTQDCSGPSVPSLVPIDEYQPTGIVRMDWGPSSDPNGGPVEYQLQWASDIMFTRTVMESQWITGTSYEVHDKTSYTRAGSVKAPLPDGTYYIRSRSRDMFEQPSAWGNAVMITIDTTPPEVPTPTPLPNYSGGASVKVSWDEVLDLSGSNVEYRVLVSLNETGDPIMETPWTMSLNTHINDLQPYHTYYFKVVSRDHLGHISQPSDVISTTMDIDGPTIALQGLGLFGKEDPFLSGEVEDTGCGVQLVELSHDGGQSWTKCAYSGGKWSYPRSALPPGIMEVLIRGQDMGGNMGAPVRAFIDETAPLITITHPLENTRIEGPVQITGSIMDPNMDHYTISCRKAGTTLWMDIIPDQSGGAFSGVLGTWNLDDLPGGTYQLRVTAVDKLAQGSEFVMNVTVAGADLSIDPAQITYSNHHPLPGEKVTVMVTISNFGGSPANDLTVTIYDNGEPVHTETGVMVNARSSMVFTTELKVSGTHRITARATSDLYDTGPMSTASVLEPTEKEMVLENIGGILGLLALILAIAAIIMVFVFRSRKEKETRPEAREEKDGVEEAEEKKKEDTSTAHVPDMKKPGQPGPALLTTPVPNRPALTGTTISTSSDPTTKMTGSSQVPTLRPAPQAAVPQLKPAPATMTPLEGPTEPAPVIVTPPSEPPGLTTVPSAPEREKPEVELPDI